MDTVTPAKNTHTQQTATDTPSTPSHRTPSTPPPDSDTSLISALFQTDSLSSDTTVPCVKDTIPPWVYPDPSGGLHRRNVAVQFVSNEPSQIEWRFDTDSAWHRYNNTPIRIGKTTAVQFRASDTCGNAMPVREEYYEIKDRSISHWCPEDMEFINVGTQKFCIDRYEWPNRKGAIPKAYISLYHAMDSCYSVGKRLCSSDEWSVACAGPYSWDYPYGQTYEPFACATRGDMAQPSGSRPECRGYFDIYDMSGNLLEWTSTRSSSNRSFYRVMGGFWESGPQSGCFDSRYSYYPQNRHNPVGFRCCKDITTENEKTGSEESHSGRE